MMRNTLVRLIFSKNVGKYDIWKMVIAGGPPRGRNFQKSSPDAKSSPILTNSKCRSRFLTMTNTMMGFIFSKNFHKY